MLISALSTALEAIEKTVIDRAVRVIYRPYLADPRPENMPILSDLHKALLDQHVPEADRVAQALDLYVSGSLNVFNHRTNVDISTPARKLRLCTLVQVTIRSPMPARPAMVPALPPQTGARRLISAAPRVISAARALSP